MALNVRRFAKIVEYCIIAILNKTIKNIFTIIKTAKNVFYILGE